MFPGYNTPHLISAAVLPQTRVGVFTALPKLLYLKYLRILLLREKGQEKGEK